MNNMLIPRGRTWIAAVLAFALLLLFAARSYPSGNDAGRMYSVASKRLDDLRKNPKKKKYRSYWIDSIRTFEQIEAKYPSSDSASAACFDRADVYRELFTISRLPRDLDASLSAYGSCSVSHPGHKRAPEARFRIVEILLDQKKDRKKALKEAEHLARSYPESLWNEKAMARLAIPSRKAVKAAELRSMPKPRIVARAAGKGSIKGIRNWSGGAYTRIVVDQDRPMNYQVRELKNPGRLVFDIANARVAESLQKQPLPVNDGILKQVRVSQFDAGTVRIVLDLESIKDYNAFQLHQPERLVIDVTGEGEAKGAVLSAASTTSAEPDPAINTTGRGDRETDYFAAGTGSGGQASGEKVSLSRQMGLKIGRIAIDAGHGGHDPGAIGRNGLREKDVTLDIAKRLAVLVREKLDCEVIMTRDRDVFIPLDERPFIAKSKGADLFVSIHVNASRKRTARGIETYIQGIQASDRDAMATAARENAMSTKRLSELDTEIDKILKDLRQDNKLEESLQLAHTVQANLVESVRPVQKRVVDLGVKRAFFYVLINTQMPSILAEVGFISNPDEEKLLKTEQYRQKIAEALFQGVKSYMHERIPQMAGI